MEENAEQIQVVSVTWGTMENGGRIWFFRDGNGLEPCEDWIMSDNPIVDATTLMWEKIRQGYTVEIQPSIWD